jgi:carboxyl-terminal processing protease
MKKTVSLRGFQVILIIIISALIGYFFGTNKVHIAWKNYLPIVAVSPSFPPSSQSLDLQLLYSVLDKVNSQYYDKTKIDTQKMLHGAIAGMLNSLDDPYTSFFPPKQNSDFKTQLAGEFSGIGAELSLATNNRIQVTAPLDGSPAQNAGIKAGDIIAKVDDQDTSGWTLSQAVDKIRGPKGTKVKIAVLHENQKELVNLEIVRDTIKIKSVKGWIKKVECIGDNCQENVSCTTCASVAYVRLSQFGDKTNDEWVEVINSLYPQMKKENNFKGIVLDVRNNPGGYLTDAVFVASEFLKSGVVVSQTDNSGGKIDLSVSRAGILTDYPVVVLINKGSASASEILSGALRDQKKTLLIGETSFGKGTIQQASDLDDGASIHVSVGKWLTPAGIWVQGKGLTPDIEIVFDSEKSKDPTKFDNQLQGAVKELLK